MKNQTTVHIVLSLLVSATLVGCTSRSGPPASVHYDRAASPYHVVKKGDSIASIARTYGMDKRELIRVNGLESPYRIVKGQRLLVRPHKDSRDQVEEREAPATEEVGSVPEDDRVDVRPLKKPGGGDNLNPEVDDEEDAGADRGLQSNRKYDEERIDEESSPSRGGGGAVPAPLPDVPTASADYKWPVRGTILRSFNPSGKGADQNDGINIGAAKGASVVAANNGVVAHAGNQLRGFGNVVLVKHENGTMTVYAHLDKVSVKKGDVVHAGQKLGTVGQTGTVKKPQLHFEIRKGRKPVDPGRYLQGSPAPAA